ncbi:glucans biosynthesis glucosyltransferase MdoH [Loktanella sp. TSTF-M6]|uniref:Glucans biosynthesis glucosyltransferase H n=2 Tax=Loktanella gaetbuli TaxID=2881335 RepID=A0ABS8BY89_9RHOB|nr:glucans biosynthesis glucosyltransferase MdoH [Loktanella gaetbuli]MCB5200707.1 glucans biosynthesis glucosyltransferase MdoH [Loktanella gaetbuli]
MQRHLRPSSVRTSRIVGISFALLCMVAAAATLAQAGLNTGFDVWDGASVLLIAITTGWLAWGAAQAFIGLPALAPAPRTTLMNGYFPATAILVPICNENPVEVCARVQAMRQSLARSGVPADFAILSDTSDPDALRTERAALASLFDQNDGLNTVYYRVREDRRGRKAGNVEDFIRRSGGNYTYVVLLDADSLMEGEAIRHLVARMEANPGLGLLQTLPRIVGAETAFGRAMQFSASFHSPVFARGLARMQGPAGPFWGHNAIARVRALAQCCGLPELTGPPPFGGTILSHDYVEAALLVRGGWQVEMDPRIDGSFEEGPENLLAFARRDRRWCQGNLQHIRLLNAPGLRKWSRFVFFQGIVSYLVSLAWGAFLIVSLLAAATAGAPNYFPDAYQLFPVFPDDRTFQIVALACGVGGLLLLPKLAIYAESVLTGRAYQFGGTLRALGSVLAETLLTALIAPLMLMYQSRAAAEVLSGRDGGWPATARGEGRLGWVEGWRAGRWITLFGVAVSIFVLRAAPDLVVWLLPVTVPMVFAPLLITVTSWPVLGGVFGVPQETSLPPVVADYRRNLARDTDPKGTVDGAIARTA